MKTATKLVGAIVLSVSVIGGVAAVNYHVNTDRHQWLIERISDKLELNVEQSAKLTALMSEMQVLRQDLRANRDTDRDELLALLTAPKLDEQQLTAMVNAKTRIIDEHTPTVVAAVASFSDSLSAAQKAELKDWLEWRFIGHRWHSDHTGGAAASESALAEDNQ